jgi:methylaspartate mutase epsilon subunit
MRFASFIDAAAQADQLVVQPRMGFALPNEMRAGLEAVKNAQAFTVGTITLDSYTRVGDHDSARRSLQEGKRLNGYPIVVHGPEATRGLVSDLQADNFPVQVRHGSAKPLDIFRAIKEAGLDATEGGPISYCLPYGRTPLAESIDAWSRCCELIAAPAGDPDAIHLESFGGCLLGQMCPPSLLVAMSILEGLFFIQHGVHSISLSYAQQTSPIQDVAALHALRALAGELLAAAHWHVVVYTYMGVFPRTPRGSEDLLAESVRLCRLGGAQRLIVKTVAEAQRIPTVAENVDALELASRVWRAQPADRRAAVDMALVAEIHGEASRIVDAVLNLHADVGVALLRAFETGYLDIPYCLHQDNRGSSRSYLDDALQLQWHSVGQMPIQAKPSSRGGRLNPSSFLAMLSSVERKFDRPYLGSSSDDRPEGDGVARIEAEQPTHALHQPSTNRPSTPKGPDMMTRKIAMIGTGPRGLAVLEQIALGLGSKPSDLQIIVIDDVEVGTGRIWRTDQCRGFLMNTVTGQVTMYSGQPDDGPRRPGAGPSLHQWLQQSGNPSWTSLGPNDFAPRYAYGHYLKDFFSVVTRFLEARAQVTVIKGRVSSLARTNGKFVLGLEDGTVVSSVSSIVLATGHSRATPSEEEQRLLDFARHRPGIHYLRADSAADLPLQLVEAGSSVGIIGMGLGFYDIVGALTLGRGGVFVEENGSLRYEPSGAEPLIVAGSRSGLPVLARGQNQKPFGAVYEPSFFTTKAVLAARARANATTGASALDFRAEVLPLIQAEMEHVYYAAHARRRGGDESAASFRQAHQASRSPGRPIDRDLLLRFALEDVVPLDLWAMGRPFRGMSFRSQDDFTQHLLCAVDADLEEATRGNVGSPLKAALDVLRDVRDLIRSTVEYGGLTAESMASDFLKDFAPVCSLLSAGPPVVRLRQLQALMKAGIVEIAGPDARFGGDPEGEGFRICSSSVAGAGWLVPTLVDSRIPTPGFSRTDSSLFRALEQGGLARSYGGAPEDQLGARCNGGLEVTRSPFQVVGADGKAVPGLYAIGIPTEKPRWFTQVGSGTPGTVSRFQLDAQAIAREVVGRRADLEKSPESSGVFDRAERNGREETPQLAAVGGA